MRLIDIGSVVGAVAYKEQCSESRTFFAAMSDNVPDVYGIASSTSSCLLGQDRGFAGQRAGSGRRAELASLGPSSATPLR